MNDIFYLSNKIIKLEDIENAAKELNATNILCIESKNMLQISYQNNVQVDWSLMGIEEFEEPDDNKYLLENKIISIYLISHHERDIEFVLKHTKLLMDKYGGLLGNDNDGYQPCFDVKNIEHFMYE